ncbi:glycosyltransferase [Thomasclavelia saccharogumia]|uniref:glycosyltransferase n=1 Tax=Thomasclavelia saccharogumia TaxID=341225 RepID=UPI000478A3E5|nr:glycosyltransferase [Thomasclavelia saccharogumia]
MKKILIVYSSMNIGGSTTSLLGLLNTIDYNKYDVELQLYRNVGPYFSLIPKEVKILPEAKLFSDNNVVSILQRIIKPYYWKYTVRSAIAKIRWPRTLASMQEMSYARALASKKNYNSYDIAIGFMEMWCNSYVIKRVKAKKKVAWIHVDYEKSGLKKEVDKKEFKNINNFVVVANSCLSGFKNIFPEFKNKVVCMENILLPEIVISRANNVDKLKTKGNGIIIGTVCRIEFRHKGLDRAFQVFLRLKNQGYKFEWHIIGNGMDFEKIKHLVEIYHMDEYIFLYGEKSNPLPLIKQFDLFFLPSYYEGKPMVITEAQMLGIPSFVTEYSSAREQIASGKDGLIVENSIDGLYNGLIYLFNNIEIINIWKENLKTKRWNYSKEVKLLNYLLEGK